MWGLGRLAIIVVGAAAALVAWGRPAAGKRVEGVVNLNTAPPELLTLLPGVGPSKADEILVYRARRPFRTVDELVRIKGIGRRMVRELRAHLAVAGPSTIRAATGPVVLPPPPPMPLPRTPARPPLLRPGPSPPPRVPGPRPPPRTHDKGPPRSWANHCAPPA
jgi:competence ComEA-like helix-hairpin-helix protein